MRFKSINVAVWVGPLALLLASCNNYLDIRSKSSLATPRSLEDCQGLLDDYTRMNASYPSYTELSADNFYLTTEDWNSLVEIKERDRYIWDVASPCLLSQWQGPYTVVYNANLVLETLNKMSGQEKNIAEYQRVKGSALFFRAYSFYQLAQLFAPAFVPGTDNNSPAIPLRLSADMDDPSSRATVAATYEQVIADLSEAATLLPEVVPLPSRPSCVAAYAALARVYLAMENYSEALAAARQSLVLNQQLLDFNMLDTLSQTPFTPRFNVEVLFHSCSYYTSSFSPYMAKIDPGLVGLYNKDDLRRMLFLNDNGDGTFSFKGSYDGEYNEILFTGLTTAEMLLTAAECHARLDNSQEALNDLNTLLETRWKTGRFTKLEGISGDGLLHLILNERRKELAFRGTRWADLRRLNREPGFAVTLRRNLGEKIYTLAPGDPAYVLPLPQEVIDYSSMPQNQYK